MQRLMRQLIEKNDANPFFAGLPKTFEYPEKILQFGEGNFMRGFVDWMVHRLNQNGLFQGRIVTVQPTPHGKIVPKLNAQDGLYTLILRGLENGVVVDQKEVITSISRGINPYSDWDEVLKAAANPQIRIVFSNTTEAGLSYLKEVYDPGVAPLSYPGKLTACLYHRYKALAGAQEAGWWIVPCELIEQNGAVLQEIVMKIADDWNLPVSFKEWLVKHNRFYITLVDRIVTGYPHDLAEQFTQELGYADELLTVGEPYHLFAIDGDSSLQELLPFDKIGLKVHWQDVKPFWELKVKILNGAHTWMCPVGYLSGKQTVLDVMEDAELNSFVTQGIFGGILPSLAMEDEAKQEFARTVLDRFRNPFNRHYLLDISINSATKFKARLLPTLLQYYTKQGIAPANISKGLAALIAFYRGEHFTEEGLLVGISAQGVYRIREAPAVLQFFYQTWKNSDSLEEVVQQVLSNKELWEMDLTKLTSFKKQVLEQLVFFAAKDRSVSP